jgi:hypothetical protein
MDVAARKNLRMLVMAWVSLVGFSTASVAESMTWTVTSDYKFRSQIEFYSQNRSMAWPGGGTVYTLNDYAPHKFTLACRRGEKICYGAWATGDG